MNLTKRKKVYRMTRLKWSLDAQNAMLIEECAELIQATNKLMRANANDESVLDNFAEEIADVEIMLEQMKYFYDYIALQEKIDKHKEHKLQRMEKTVMMR